MSERSHCGNGVMQLPTGQRCYYDAIGLTKAASRYSYKEPQAASEVQGNPLHASHGTSPHCSDKCVEPNTIYLHIARYMALSWSDMFGAAE